MNKKPDTIKDFIEVFPDATSKEYCEKIINRFNYVQETQSSWDKISKGRIWSRQDMPSEKGITRIEKEDNTYFLGSTEEEDKILMSTDLTLLDEFSQITWNCYRKYADQYGILDNVSQHKISPVVKIQKTEPSQGYHIWHCDNGSVSTSRKMLVITLYLSTVKDGGETEFLYQNKRVPAVQGTLAIFPTSFTHTHRGNPPLKETKYIITSWIEYSE